MEFHSLNYCSSLTKEGGEYDLNFEVLMLLLQTVFVILAYFKR